MKKFIEKIKAFFKAFVSSPIWKPMGGVFMALFLLLGYYGGVFTLLNEDWLCGTGILVCVGFGTKPIVTIIKNSFPSNNQEVE